MVRLRRAPDRRRIHGRGVNQEADRRARRGVPVADVLGHRQHRFLAGERLAQDVGEESGSRLVGKAGTDADGRQADADAVHEAAARIVGQQQLADRLLGAVAQERRMEEFVADRFRKRRAEHRDRRGEHDPRLVAAAGKPDRIEQHPRAVEVDAIALVEIEFGLAGDDRRQMEDHVGTIRHQLFGGTGYGEVAGHGIDRKSGLAGLAGATTSCSVIRVMSRLTRDGRRATAARSICGRPCRPLPEPICARRISLLFLYSSFFCVPGRGPERFPGTIDRRVRLAFTRDGYEIAYQQPCRNRDQNVRIRSGSV